MRTFIFGLLLSVCSAAYAYDEHGPVTTVTYIYSNVDGGLPFIRFGENSMPGCHGESGGYLPASNSEGMQRTYSLILAAYLSQKPMSVYYDYKNIDPSYNGWGKCHITAVDLR